MGRFYTIYNYSVPGGKQRRGLEVNQAKLHFLLEDVLTVGG